MLPDNIPCMENPDIAAWVRRSGLTKSAVSALSGASLSTIHRIQNQQTDPQLGTLRELAIACGLDLDVHVRPLADPYAAQAVRMLLETGFSPDNQRKADEWICRFERAQLSTPFDLLKAAGRSVGLLHLSSPSTYLRGAATPLRLASAGDASGGQWALSGKSHLELAAARELFGQQVIWAEDAGRVVSNLRDSLTVARSASTATVIVAQATPALFQQFFTHERINYVTPVQSLIDGLSLGGILADTATDIAQEW